MYLHFQFSHDACESILIPEPYQQYRNGLLQVRYFDFDKGKLLCQWQDLDTVYPMRIWQHRFWSASAPQQCRVTSSKDLVTLVFVTEGTARLQINGQELRLEQGKHYLLSIPRDVTGFLQFQDVFCALQVDPDEYLLNRLLAKLPYADLIQQLQDLGLSRKVPVWATGRYSKRAATYLSLPHLRSGDFVTYFSLRMMSLLRMYHGQLDAAPAKHIRACCLREQIYTYIRAHLDDPDLLKNLPVGFHMSKRRMERLFASEEQSLSVYIRKERMKSAIRLLRQTELPIKEIALRCGMSSINSFSRAFRKHFHKTPTDFRQAAGVIS